MKKRYKMKGKSSKRQFRKGTKINKINTRPRPGRGGTRL